MKRLAIILFLAVLFTSALQAQGPRGNSFGFGIILGNPTGLTGKLWLNNENALAFAVGGDYFGVPRIGIDYLWHFDAFNSRIVKLYAGPGAAIGFGREGWAWGWHKNGKDKFYWREDDEDFGFGARVVFGLNIIPRRTPLEIFAELGGLVGVVPDFGFGVDGAIGIRFYP